MTHMQKRFWKHMTELNGEWEIPIIKTLPMK